MNGVTSITHLHLMYEHDVLLFTKANTRSLRCIMQILEDFYTFTGPEVNKNKSSTTFSKVFQGNPELQNIIGFIVKQLYITYLGLPISGKKKTKNQCWNLIQPIEKLLDK